MSPAATSALNCARVGALSRPLKPPIAMTALPLASCSGAALLAPVVAAAHRDVVAFSSVVKALSAVVLPPPGPPIVLVTGPADGMLPVCGWLAVETAYAA